MSKEEKTPEAPESAPAKGGSKLVPILLVLTLAVNGLLAFIYVTDDGPSSVAAAEEPEDEEETADDEMSEQPGPIITLDPFVVNLSEPQGTRYLRVTLGMEIRSEETRAEVEARIPVLRDRFISHLAAQQSEVIQSVTEKDRLRSELLAMARDVVSQRSIVGLYFTEFIIQ
ncbi:MAG: flagellar basal body-associated FliL family protein [Myxococcales bacterium]|nr:flagellar basal body-associated FliL family protein [Myxococcales bacterium]